MGDMDEIVRVIGNERFDEVECDQLVVTGALNVEKSINASSIDISGTVVAAEDVVASTITVTGSLRVFGALKADEVIVSGDLFVENSTIVDSLTANGNIDVTNIQSDSISGPKKLIIDDIIADKFKIDNR